MAFNFGQVSSPSSGSTNTGGGFNFGQTSSPSPSSAQPTPSQPSSNGSIPILSGIGNFFSGVKNEVSNIIQEPSRLVTDFPSTLKTLADLQIDPLSFKADPGKAIQDAGNALSQAWSSYTQAESSAYTALHNPNASISSKIGSELQDIAAGAGVVFSPISAFFAAANDIPVVGSIAKLITLPFSFAGESASDLSGGIIDQLPISQQAKNNLKPGISEIASLAAQIGLGKASDIGAEKVADLSTKFSPADTRTIIDQATGLAKDMAANSSDPYASARVDLKSTKLDLTPADSTLNPIIDSVDAIMESNGKSIQRTLETNPSETTQGEGGQTSISETNQTPQLTNESIDQNRRRSQTTNIPGQGSENIANSERPIGQRNTGIESTPAETTQPGGNNSRGTEPGTGNTSGNGQGLKNNRPEKIILPNSESPTMVREGNKYGSELYHETSANNAREILRRINGEYPVKLALTNDKDLALGQGGKGVIITLDANKTKVSFNPNFKPGAELLHRQGITDELVSRYIDPEKGVKSIEVPKKDFNTGEHNQGIQMSQITSAGLDRIPKELSNGNLLFTKKEVPEISAESSQSLKVSKIAKEIEAKAVEKKLTEGYSKLAGYEPITIKEQARLATDLVNNHFEDAMAIVRGEKPLPEGLKGTSLITALEEHLKNNPDVNLLQDLAKSRLVSGTSQAAQELRLAAERDPYSPVEIMRQLENDRRATLEKQYKEPLEKTIDKEVKKIQDSVKKAAPDKNEWKSFINDIVCGGNA